MDGRHSWPRTSWTGCDGRSAVASYDLLTEQTGCPPPALSAAAESVSTPPGGFAWRSLYGNLVVVVAT